jgi:hypothetical protein
LKSARELSAAGRAASEASNQANGHSDLYVLHTVLFALSLFFLGSSSSARHAGVRRTMSILGGLVFVVAVISMARLPRAPDAPRAKVAWKSTVQSLAFVLVTQPLSPIP